jgi:signal transduction histidine kinase
MLLRLKQGALRQVAVVGGLCLAIALVLTALDGRGFGTKLVYSLCIGGVCTVLVGGTRLFAAWWTERARRLSGTVQQDTPAASGWRGVVAGSLLAMVLGPLLGLWLADQFTGNESASLLDWGSVSTRMTLVFAVLGTVISLLGISTWERLSFARAQAEAARRQAAEHQLRLLQSQLEPHMLFNTLANLRVLIGLDPPQAQAMLDRLISFLRATLNASRLSAHPLATEFDRIADYLALMGVRMGARLQSRLDLPPSLRDLPVPPLLLQPLVENAIKHGLEPHVQGGCITVSAAVEGPQLRLTVCDTGAGLKGPASQAPGTGFGLSQVRERLATLYGAEGGLTLQDAPDGPGGTLATLLMPLPKPP